MIASRRKLPPFGAELAQRLRGDLSCWWGASPSGKAAPILLLTGTDGWRAAQDWRNYRLIVLHPHGTDPNAYDWRIVAGHDPVLLWRCGQVGGDQVLALLKAIMRDGTRRVLDVATHQLYVAKEVTHAAAVA